MKWRLEAIEWEDVTSVSRFTLDHDFEAERLYKLSVGFVIWETPEYVVLADDVDASRRPRSPNNYGTIIPKGCIRSRRVVHAEVARESELQGTTSNSGELARRFFDLNPQALVTAHDIALGMGLDQTEAQRQLAELERTGEVQQALPGLWRRARQTARRNG